MHDDFSKPYTASKFESEIYANWEQSGAFSPHNDLSKPIFSLVMPPLNSNGNMHMGHALALAIEDTLVRWHRMLGDRTLWLPGTDHAGIETQVVFEKKLEKEGRSRFQMEREQFRREALEFTLENKQHIESQARLLGASADWTANRFTLDPQVVEGVYATFKQMFADGLIYRGERIVNYSTKYRTAYSDLEVEYEEREDPLYYITYGPITVATVRPETKFAEKVIVVHPDDPRYQEYIGTRIKAKVVTGEELDMLVIADTVIKPEFGTGAMTITPAHDPIDFDIAQRHQLPIVPIIGLDGRLLPIAGEFAGMKVAEARKAVAARMQELGLIAKIDPHYSHAVALDYKSKQPIEPLIMPQWYVKVGPLRDRAIEAIRAGEVRFHPESYQKVMLDWLEGLRDWNISRQIWWGIPINGCGLPETDNDPDTFDTWFSSSQWPYLALGDLQEFYPNSVMETGRDIIFLWVSRMLFMGLYRKGEVPFRDVYLHGLVLDRQGKKMSKSKGNVVSPVDLIALYGCDAVRFGLLIGSSAGSDIPLPEEKIIGGRNFCNKLWNISRFVLTQLALTNTRSLPEPVAVTEADTEILQSLQEVQKAVTEHLEQFRFAQALQELHEFIWHCFADKYVEQAKAQPGPLTTAILWQVLTTSLTLLHPFMPFVTEAIWQRLPDTDQSLIITSWPN